MWFACRSPEGFRWLTEDNPGQNGLPAGWVVEDGDDGICAFLGNFVQRAWRLGEAFPVAAGHSFVAAPGHGGRALSLLRTFLRQKEPILLSGMNSNPVSAELYQAMRLSAYPDTASLKLSWITNPAIAVIGAVSWRAHGALGQRFARRVPDFARRAPDVAGILARHGGQVERITDPLANPRLAAFDAALRTGARLFAERSPEALAWRLDDPDTAILPVLLAYPASGAIRGLALFQFNKPSEAEPPYLDVTDLVTLDPDDAEAAQALMRTGLLLARQSGVARLRLSLVTKRLLGLLAPFASSARRSVSAAPHAFFKANPQTPQPIAQYWQPLPYDGDNGPSLRPMPVVS